MSLTGLVFLLIYVAGLIMTFSNPVYGVALYFFEWHNHPPYWWWGENLPDLRWTFTIAIVTLGSFFINRKKLMFLKEVDYKPVFWLILYTVNAYLVSYMFAILPDTSLDKSEAILKLTINYVLMIYLIQRPKDFKFVVLVILLGVANFGRVAWEQGSNRDLGVIAPGATGGNLIAGYMMSIVPFYGALFFLGKRWEKIFALISVPFVLNALILENSRSTILGLLVIALLSPFFVKGKLRMRLIVAMVFASLIFLQLTDNQFWERQETTEHYQEDHSAMSRFWLWKGGLRFMKDYPFGGGAEGFEEVAPDYVPELRDTFARKGNRTVHNTFINTATEWGWQGLIIYVGFLLHTVIILFGIRRKAKFLPASFPFYNMYTACILLGYAGTIVLGIFQNRQYAEHVFWFSAFAVALKNIQNAELKKMMNPEPEPIVPAEATVGNENSGTSVQITPPRS